MSSDYAEGTILKTNAIWANAKTKETSKYLNNHYIRLNSIQIAAKSLDDTLLLMKEIEDVIRERNKYAEATEKDIVKLHENRNLIADEERKHYEGNKKEDSTLSPIEALRHTELVRASVVADLQLAEAYKEKAHTNETNMFLVDDYSALSVHYYRLLEINGDNA